MTNDKNDYQFNDHLKKAWFSHVLSTLEKLDEHIDNLSDELHKAKDECFKEIISVKEQIRKEMVNCKKSCVHDWEKIEEHLNRRLENLELSTSKSDMKDEIRKIKDEVIKIVDPIKESVWVLKAKVAMWALLFSMVGSSIMGTIFMLLKDYLSKP